MEGEEKGNEGKKGELGNRSKNRGDENKGVEGNAREPSLACLLIKS